MKQALCLATFLLSSCSLETTVLVGPRYSQGDTVIALDLNVTHKMKGRKVCSYIHNSDPARGIPFNDEYENTFDMLGCGLRFD